MEFVCQKCGKCCQNIILPFRTGGDEQRWLEVHDIKIIKNKYGEFIDIPIKCKYLTAENNCSIYNARPQNCYNYQCDNDFLKKL